MKKFALAAVLAFLSSCGQQGLDGMWSLKSSEGKEASDPSFKISGDKYIPQGSDSNLSCEYSFSRLGANFKISTPATTNNRCAKIEREWTYEQPNNDELVFKKNGSRFVYGRVGKGAQAISNLSADELKKYFDTSRKLTLQKAIPASGSSEVYLVNGEARSSRGGESTYCSIYVGYESGSASSAIPAGSVFTSTYSRIYSGNFSVEFQVKFPNESRERYMSLNCYGSGPLTGAQLAQSLGSFFQF